MQCGGPAVANFPQWWSLVRLCDFLRLVLMLSDHPPHHQGAIHGEWYVLEISDEMPIWELASPAVMSFMLVRS